jgi:hypothetical protein
MRASSAKPAIVRFTWRGSISTEAAIKFKATCQSTGIGSLPLKDPNAACSLSIRSFDIPLWPQLPRRSFLEGTVAQFSEKIPGITCDKDSLRFDPAKKDAQLEGFYERVIARDADYFAPSAAYAQGLHSFLTLLQKKSVTAPFVKGHITGPFTFAGAVKDPQGKALLSDPVMVEAVTSALSLKALWQIRQFKKAGKEPVIFIDEPYLGCFGSAYTPLSGSQVTAILSQLIEGIRQEDNALLGIHCCGNTDWGLLLNLDIDIISFDAFGFLDRFLLYEKEIKAFFKKGKTVAWGVVPTVSPERSSTTPDQLIQLFEKRVLEALHRKGIDRVQLLEQSLLTPSCGLGDFDVSRSTAEVDTTLGLLRQVSGHFTK